ncbi:MAG: HEAT repeat domain-containing protein [Deltaproteobacteria bacterium]|nr:HEAT repeat domain-containing protein [Deltaproteobacteria bacterium]
MIDQSNIRQKLGDDDPYVRRDACEAIGEARALDFIQELVRLLKDEHPGVRESALNALTSIGGRHVAEAIAPLLKLEDVALRNIGIEILRQLGPEALEALSGLLTDKDDDVVKFAIDILASIGETGAAGMISTLSEHKNPNVRASVAVCFGRLRSTGSVPALLRILNDSEEWVRFSAIEGLGLLQDKSALAPLLGVIAGGSGLLKEAALESLGKIASHADAAEVLVKLEEFIRFGGLISPNSVVRLLEKALSPGSTFRPTREFKEAYFSFLSSAMEDGELDCRLSAIKGFGLLKMPDGIGRVLKFINSQKELSEDTEALLVDAIVSMTGGGPIPEALKTEVVKGGKALKVIVGTFGELKSEEAVPILASLIGKAAKHELREVVTALESIGSPDSVDVLMKALKNPDGHTRKISARALGTLLGEGAQEALFEALQKEAYRDVLEEMTDTVATIASEYVKNGLCALLSSQREDLREMGARGLGLVGDEEALRFLREAARDRSPNVRKMSYKSMARLGIPEAADSVVRGLKDENDDVKLSVLKALGGWTGDLIKTALLESLRDRNLWVRYHAVALLGDMEDAGVEDAVIEVLKKDEAPVKAAAAKALEAIGSRKALPELKMFVNHPDAQVRAAVENAIERVESGC